MKTKTYSVIAYHKDGTASHRANHSLLLESAQREARELNYKPQFEGLKYKYKLEE